MLTSSKHHLPVIILPPYPYIRGLVSENEISEFVSLTMLSIEGIKSEISLGTAAL